MITRSRSFAGGVPDLEAFTASGLALLVSLYPLSKGIRLLGLGLHNLAEYPQEEPIQLGLAI